jgi:hypothetical protein
VLSVLVGLALLIIATAPASASCSATAWAGFQACQTDILDDYWEAAGLCFNVSDLDERGECFGEARDDWQEGREECFEVRDARYELCDLLGEEPYEPELDPADFTDDFDNRNPYLPLFVGNRWVLEEDDESFVTIEVLAETKRIDGVTAIVVNDLEVEEGVIVEDTDDWFALEAGGDVWYMGEISRNFESFAGDDPETPELVDIEGSWKAGRDDALPGILIRATPIEGEAYRQEFAFGDAEDAVEVLDADYAYPCDCELDEFSKDAEENADAAELVELLCGDGGCVVTFDFTPLEPESTERKYYAPGVGVFLEVDLEEGGFAKLVECNVAPVCEQLP